MGPVRLQCDGDMGVVFLFSDFAVECALALDNPGDGFFVSHLGRADIGRDIIFLEYPVLDDFQMQFAHPGYDGLGRLLVCLDLEGRVIVGQFT